MLIASEGNVVKPFFIVKICSIDIYDVTLYVQIQLMSSSAQHPSTHEVTTNKQKKESGCRWGIEEWLILT